MDTNPHICEKMSEPALWSCVFWFIWFKSVRYRTFQVWSRYLLSKYVWSKSSEKRGKSCTELFLNVFKPRWTSSGFLSRTLPFTLIGAGSAGDTPPQASHRPNFTALITKWVLLTVSVWNVSMLVTDFTQKSRQMWKRCFYEKKWVSRTTAATAVTNTSKSTLTRGGTR